MEDNKDIQQPSWGDKAASWLGSLWQGISDVTHALIGALWGGLKEIGGLKIIKTIAYGVIALIVAWAGWKYYSVETYAVCIKMDDKGKTQDMTKPMKLKSKAHTKIAQGLSSKDWVCEEYKVDMEMIDLLNTMYISHTETLKSKGQ